jgi:hypothetical protein
LQLVFGETQIEKTKEQEYILHASRFDGATYSAYKADKPPLTEDISVPKMKIKKRKFKTISTSSIKILEDSKKAKIN